MRELADATVLVQCEHPEMDAVLAERDALLPVVEAARVWRRANDGKGPWDQRAYEAKALGLAAAVDAYEAQQKGDGDGNE